MLRFLLAVLLAVTTVTAVGAADDQRSAMVQKLYELSQDFTGGKILPVRGGTKDKPLGLYLGTKDDVVFRSGYKNVEPRTQCEWAYDLHQFIVDNGGGWENFQKYQKENPPTTDSASLLNESLKSYGGGKDPKDPWERAHVPYDKQAAFADKWWKNNSQAYEKSVVPPKDWWTHDAILDANNLWSRYEMLSEKATSEHTLWRDADLVKLTKKQ
jgi:hypothetical protein